jgi:hypothetical protein
MGFQFAGFFAQAQPTLLESALQRWPGCRGRVVTEPFRGVAIAVPEHALNDGSSDEEQEQAQSLAWAIEDELVEWSQQFPGAVFVFVTADCFGGHCEYAGYICGNGVLRKRIPETGYGGNDVLARLVHVLGVDLDEAYSFAPLTRGFFDHE